MAIDADKIDHGVTKGKAVIVFHTWKDHLWAIGSKGEPPEAVAVSAAGGEATDAGDDKDAGADGDGDSGGGHEPVRDHPAEVTDGPVSRTEEKLTPEGMVFPQHSYH
jgi:translation initiation factor 2D